MHRSRVFSGQITNWLMQMRIRAQVFDFFAISNSRRTVRIVRQYRDNAVYAIIGMATRIANSRQRKAPAWTGSEAGNSRGKSPSRDRGIYLFALSISSSRAVLSPSRGANHASCGRTNWSTDRLFNSAVCAAVGGVQRRDVCVYLDVICPDIRAQAT